MNIIWKNELTMEIGEISQLLHKGTLEVRASMKKRE